MVRGSSSIFLHLCESGRTARFETFEVPSTIINYQLLPSATTASTATATRPSSTATRPRSPSTTTRPSLTATRPSSTINCYTATVDFDRHRGRVPTLPCSALPRPAPPCPALPRPALSRSEPLRALFPTLPIEAPARSNATPLPCSCCSASLGLPLFPSLPLSFPPPQAPHMTYDKPLAGGRNPNVSQPPSSNEYTTPPPPLPSP